ncbi:hypothetical protein DBR32_01330 [Taibaiella sp. KBW10]|uniref:ribosomal protein L7/L12 n=1 Tax=Taibaiella sp. KBW10 TaxID=2153357 RepID=UPI000F5A4D9C|nr:ribosomal protein L7/L12 [Taibaiella sp. KBW10]RQO32280.1 hypothetical protein DBR32_01330 [Taibaiella sp. KBW10]
MLQSEQEKYKALEEKGIKLDAFIRLLEEDRKIEAIKMLIESTGMGLKEAKDFVDQLTQNGSTDHTASYRQRSSESVKMQSNKGKTVITYTNTEGQVKIVNPDSPEWPDVRRLMGDHKMLQSYEAAYSRQVSDAETTDIDRLLLAQGPKRSVWPRYLVMILILLLFAYFFFVK